MSLTQTRSINEAYFMFERHGWISLSDSPDDPEPSIIDERVRRLKLRASEIEGNHWSVSIDIVVLNGGWAILLFAYPNRRGQEIIWMDDFVDYSLDLLPGSWGLIYDRDDGLPAGLRESFSVTMITRGQIWHP
ncbi:MAG: Imm7 family immunity protein, partial [Jatrophihabitantaceae bacterium]